MPVQTYFLHHLVVTTLFVRSINRIQQNNNIQHYPRSNVCAMETGNAKEEIEKYNFIFDYILIINYL